MKLVLFDFDGTIADTMNDYAEIAADVLEKHLNMPRDIAKQGYFETSGIPFREQIAIVNAYEEVDSKEIIKEFEGRKTQLTETCNYFPVVPSTLQILKKSYKLGIVSSNYESFVKYVLKRWKLYDQFVHVSGVGLYKDKHEQIKAAMAYLNCVPADVLYVGDSKFDYEVASSLRVNFFQVAPPDISIDGVFEVISEFEHDDVRV